jgi:hypothetical protein
VVEEVGNSAASDVAGDSVADLSVVSYALPKRNPAEVILNRTGQLTFDAHAQKAAPLAVKGLSLDPLQSQSGQDSDPENTYGSVFHLGIGFGMSEPTSRMVGK